MVDLEPSLRIGSYFKNNTPSVILEQQSVDIVAGEGGIYNC